MSVKKPRIVEVDRPVFKLADPNDPVKYILKNKWSSGANKKDTDLEAEVPELEKLENTDADEMTSEELLRLWRWKHLFNGGE